MAENTLTADQTNLSPPPTNLTPDPNRATVSGTEVQAINGLSLDIARSDVVEIRIVDTDIVLILADGRRIFIRDGAVQAVIDPSFSVSFSDGIEEVGQSLIQAAGTSEIGRVALSGPLGGREETVVIVQVPVPYPVSVPLPPVPTETPAQNAASANNGGSSVRPWQTYAMIGAPLVGGLVAASGALSAAPAPPPQDVTTPVIFSVAENDIVSATEKARGVTVSGRAEQGARVEIFWDNAAKTTFADEAGLWTTTFSPTEVPADGARVTITATAFARSVRSPTANRFVSIDTTPPPAPTLTIYDEGFDRGNFARSSTITLTGRSEADSTVLLSWGRLNRVVTANAFGEWEVVVNPSDLPIQVAPRDVTVYAIDRNGNTGPATSAGVTLQMTASDIAGLTIGQFSEMTGLDISSLTTSAVAAIRSDQAASLSNEKIVALGTNVASLNDNALFALTPGQFNSFTQSQTEVLTADSVRKLSTQTVEGLSVEKINELNQLGFLDDLLFGNIDDPLYNLLLGRLADPQDTYGPDDFDFSKIPSFDFAQLEALDLGYIDTQAELNLFNDVIRSLRGSSSSIDLAAIAAGASAVMGAVQTDGSVLTLAHLEALNLNIGFGAAESLISPNADNLARIQSTFNNVGENTEWFDSVSELRRLVAFADGSPLRIGSSTETEIKPANFSLWGPALVEGKLYYSISLRPTPAIPVGTERFNYQDWVRRLGEDFLNPEGFTHTTVHGEYLLRVPGLGRPVNTSGRPTNNAFPLTDAFDRDGDMNPNSIPTLDDWAAILDSFQDGPRVGATVAYPDWNAGAFAFTSQTFDNGTGIMQLSPFGYNYISDYINRTDYNGAVIVELIL